MLKREDRVYEYLSLLIIIVWLSFSYIYGGIKSRKTKSAIDWFVAGRGLGLIVLWLSLGANIYSSYTFLGIPGIAAREGFRALTIVLYGMISFIVGFWLIPLLWRSARDRGWLTIADAYGDLYKSRFMAIYAALAGSLWSIPYIQLQLQGMSYILETASYGLIPHTYAILASFIFLALIIAIGGMVSLTSINALQGAIMLIAIWLLGLLSPILAFGGYHQLFNIIAGGADKISTFHLTPELTDYIFLYTVIFAAPLGFWLWPNRVHNIFAARSEKIVKKNMVLTGIYQLSQIPAILVGLTATALYLTGELGLPITSKDVADKSFMLVATKLYNPVVVGIIGAGAIAASISTAAALLHACSALFSKNIAMIKDEKKLILAARMFTLGIAGISAYLALYMPGILVYLLLVGYGGIIQLFPAYILALKKPKYANKYLAVTSSLAGMIAVLYFKTYKPIKGVYEGFAGLAVNLAILGLGILVLKLTRRISINKEEK